jgi:hypothetical protein
MVPEDLAAHRFFMRKRRLAARRFVRVRRRAKMWALFYEGGQVSREYPDEAAVWRALRQAGMLDEDLFHEGYEIKQVEQERESAFV